MVSPARNWCLAWAALPTPTERFYEKLRALEEQLITGMHLVPMLVGRSYGPSGTWAEAQARLMERAAISAQLGIKRMIERVYDLALKLWGFPEYRTEVQFHRTNLQESLKQAQAEKLTLETGVEMREAGLINLDQLAARMGLGAADQATPKRSRKGN